MSINKFWFRNVETMDRITVFIDNEFKLCDDFLTIYQLQAFAQSDDSEFITSESNKSLGFTLAEFNSCDQTCLTTLPSQYELYFTVQPHTKPEVEILIDDEDKSKRDRYCRIFFKSINAWRKLIAEIDDNEFYTVTTLYRIVKEDGIGFMMSSIYISYEEQCSKGWLGKNLINTLDNAEHYGCDVYPYTGFYIYLPEVEEDNPSPEQLRRYAHKFKEAKQAKQENKEKTMEEVTSDKSTRQYILERAIETCCHDRQNQYGEPEDSFRAIACLWDDYIHLKYDKDAKNGNSIPLATFCFTREDVSIMMALMKIARQMYGQGKMDNFVDTSAYIAIAGEMWSEGQKK